MTSEEMTPEWLRKEIEEVSSWGQFTISFDCKRYLSLLTAIEEARNLAEYCVDALGMVGAKISIPWKPYGEERPNPETPRGE